MAAKKGKIVRIETSLSETEAEDFRLICSMAGETQRDVAAGIFREFISEHRPTLEKFRSAKASVQKAAGLQRRAKRSDPIGM